MDTYLYIIAPLHARVYSVLVVFSVYQCKYILTYVHKLTFTPVSAGRNIFDAASAAHRR